MDDATLSGRADGRQEAIPDLGPIVDSLEPLLGQLGGDPEPLEGGITNRNFRVTFGGTEYVLRIPGKDTDALGIDRNAERVANQRAAEAGIAPPVAAALSDPQCLVTEFIEGREMTAEELRAPGCIAEVARALRAFHDSGDVLPTSFASLRVVEEYAGEVTSRGGALPGAYDAARECARRIDAALDGPEHEPVPCHNDLLAANFLHDGDRIRIVDWEYAGMGDRYFDLGNFAVNNELTAEDDVRLLEAYFGEPPSAAQRASLGLLRFMSDFREAMWGAVQGSVSDLDFDFAGYAEKHFARMGETMADAELERMLEVASGQT